MSDKPKCQMTMHNDAFNEYFPCGRPARAWIPDRNNRIGFNGRQYLCGIHERAHNKVSERLARPLATRIEP